MNQEAAKLTESEFKQLLKRLESVELFKLDAVERKLDKELKDPELEILGVFKGDRISVSVFVQDEFGSKKVILAIL